MLSVTSQAQVKQSTGRFDMFRKLFRRQDRRVDKQQSEKSPNGVKPNTELDLLDIHMKRHKPESLEKLCQITKFSRKEIRSLYRGFKQQCPTGIVDEDTFQDIFAQFFPHGDSSSYAHHVFRTFDKDKNGIVNFEECAVGLSILLHGSIADKLHWAFQLYDADNNGEISKSEMLDIVKAIYELMGRFSEPIVDDNTAKRHAEIVFQSMDKNADGVISEDEFYESCKQEESVLSSIMVLDTVLS